MAVTNGKIFDDDKVVPLSMEGMKELGIAAIVGGRRILGGKRSGMTRNAWSYVAESSVLNPILASRIVHHLNIYF